MPEIPIGRSHIFYSHMSFFFFFFRLGGGGLMAILFFFFRLSTRGPQGSWNSCESGLEPCYTLEITCVCVRKTTLEMAS